MPVTEMPENSSDSAAAVVVDIEGNDCKSNANAKNIGWNIKKPEQPSDLSPPKFLADVQESHKHITDRFVELLSLFENYSRIMSNEQMPYKPQSKLKRTQSEKFTKEHTQLERNSSELLRATVSLNRMQLSNSTLLATPCKVTRESACQTSSHEVSHDQDDKRQLLMALEKSGKIMQNRRNENLMTSAPYQHTLHIEVESVSSATALQRAPLRQRMWQVAVEAWRSLVACFAMMGENFTYVLFVVLCLWCLYLIISHYYSFLGSSLSPRGDATSTLARVRGKPI
ncbi:uncharacterized protein LOC132798275 [Drosophila nasuta]|uniref:uncharacterized protein LOC132798275 n=1 Tax=Drosophila nasuta TaxID=42062 RepID=UPI00295E8349|nr:uncharacterized protein LOC132798275 [Drosophila nasuta]